IAIPGIFLFSEIQAQSQIKTYYDSTGTVLKENYTILNQDSNMVHGSYTMFHENGQVAVEGSFVKGQKDGQFKEFYPDGNIKREMRYKEGLREGEVVIYNPNGKLAQQGVFLNDTLTGNLAVYYPDGDIKSQTAFESGKPQGWVISDYPAVSNNNRS